MVLWRSQPLTPNQTRDRAATHPQPQLQHLALDFFDPNADSPEPGEGPTLEPPQSVEASRVGASAEKSSVGARALDASEANCRVARSRGPWLDAVSRGASLPATRPASPDGRKEASGSAFDSRSTPADAGGGSRGPGHCRSKTDTSE